MEPPQQNGPKNGPMEPPDPDGPLPLGPLDPTDINQKVNRLLQGFRATIEPTCHRGYVMGAVLYKQGGTREAMLTNLGDFCL